MNIRINSIKTGLVSALFALSALSCQKQHYKPLPAEYIPQKTYSNLDSLIKEGEKITSDPSFIQLGYDTVELNKDFAHNPKEFNAKVNERLSDKYNDKIITIDDTYSYTDPQGKGLIDVLHKTNMYTNKTAVLKSNKLFTTNNNNMFVPVEYYAKFNPKILPYLKTQKSILSFFKDFYTAKTTFKKMPESYVPARIKTAIKTIQKGNTVPNNNENYTFLGRDTILFTNDMAEKPENFNKNVMKDKFNRLVKTGTIFISDGSMTGCEKTAARAFSDYFINKKAVRVFLLKLIGIFNLSTNSDNLSPDI